MSVLADGKAAHAESKDVLVKRKSIFRSWIFSYEIYVIIIVATFLRLYGIYATEFDRDQADFFFLARNAVIHGHLVATSTTASIGVYNPPVFMYVLMIPAALSGNPIGGVIETALLAVFGVFLTYWFTRRYYGRVAATIASSLFAVTSVSIYFSRFIWNPNLLLGFVPLFIFVLFRGAVDRKPGWLFPAIFLYGLLYAWHGSSLLLAAPFAVALLLAPGTIRWYDIVLGILSLLVLYSPYIVWLIASHSSILEVFFEVGGGSLVVDNASWLLYLHFLNPYDKPLTNTLALLYGWQRYFNWLQPVMKYLVIAAALFVSFLALFSRTKKIEFGAARAMASWWRKLWYWILDLRGSPYRCGLLVLLSWQVFPLLAVIRHTLVLFPHYLIILMPGPFILIGILLARSAHWFRIRGQWYRLVSSGIYAFSALLILFQGIAGAASVIDATQGHYVDKYLSRPYYTDLNSVQQALAKADEIAQKDHISRVIVVADEATRSPFRDMSEQLHTPATVVDDSCLLLPGPTAGPAVVLVPPYETMLDAFFSSQYVHVSKSYTSMRMGGDPFRLYVVDPLPQTAMQATLSSDIQFVDAQAQNLQKKLWAVTRWNLLRSASASTRVTYSYQFTDTVAASTQRQQVCTSTSIHAGDQLIAFLPHTGNQTSLHIQVEHSSTVPYTIRTNLFGAIPLAFDTFRQDSTPWTLLRTQSGASAITVPVASS
jgi:4-amino-4-deoxy-L-arabinose transferase-like glycosyltransferase